MGAVARRLGTVTLAPTCESGFTYQGHLAPRPAFKQSCFLGTYGHQGCALVCKGLTLLQIGVRCWVTAPPPRVPRPGPRG